MFRDSQIRRVFHQNEWWYSVVDIIAALTDSDRPSKYWSDLKKHLEDEGNQPSDYIGQLKMPAEDGKLRDTDAVKTEDVLRIVQSIPSKKAEPFKRWLARVGYERIQESQNPEIGIKRAILNYKIQGYPNDWIDARVRTILSRKELTDEWQQRGVKPGVEYGMLTDEISKGTFGIKTQQHKSIKGLSKAHNLRDHMTDMELILTMLGEKSTSQIARAIDAQGFEENKLAASAGGDVAGSARQNLEKQLGGRTVVSGTNYLDPKTQEQKLELPEEANATIKKILDGDQSAER